MKRKRKRGWEDKRYSIGCFIPQMTATTKAEPGGIWEPRTPGRSFMSVAGTQEPTAVVEAGTLTRDGYGR